MLAAASANAALAGTLAAQLQALSATLEQVNQGKAAALAGLMAPPGGAWNQGSGGLSARLAAEMAAMAQREAQLAALLSVVAVVPVASVEHLRGAWGGIAADLGAGQDALAAAIAEQEPFLLGCDLAMAALQWQQVADEAAAFAAQLN